jgi:hypothetical protein
VNVENKRGLLFSTHVVVGIYAAASGLMQDDAFEKVGPARLVISDIKNTFSETQASPSFDKKSVGSTV